MPYQSFLDTLSAPRSGVYKRVFRTRTPAETSGAVLWGQAMAAALQSLMHTFEVALRNRIHVSMSRQASESSGRSTDSFAWYDHKIGKYKLEGESFEQVERILCDEKKMRLPFQPSPDRVVARLSFGVWPNILDQQLPTPSIQARTFLEVFPHYPRKPRQHWNHAGNRKGAVDKVKDVKGWRNRLAHCKPVWSTGWYRTSSTQHWTEVLDRIRSRRTEVLNILEWICPQTVEVYKLSYCGRQFDELATEQAVLAHVTNQQLISIGPGHSTIDMELLREYRGRA